MSTETSASYRSTPFYCGTCEGALDFMSRGGLIPGAWYVHRDDHRYHCHGRRHGSHTATAGMIFGDGRNWYLSGSDLTPRPAPAGFAEGDR